MALAPILARGGGPAADALFRHRDRHEVPQGAGGRPAGDRHLKAFSLLDRGWAVEQQELAHARGLLAPGWMPQSEVSNLVQPLRQDVLEEPAHEFVARHAAGPPLVTVLHGSEGQAQ
jgi:hypothetical protein